MPRVRLASALLVSEPFAREIDGLRRAMGEHPERVPPHLTLVPPVNIRTDDLPAVFAHVRGAAAATDSITVTLGPAVTFHPVNPVVYLEVGGEVDAVRALRDRVCSGPLTRPSEHDFVPHVTVVESTTPERIEAALVALADYRVEVTFDAVHVLQQQEQVWRPIADSRFEQPLVIGRGGIETVITASAIADPQVVEFAGDPPHANVQVVVARREGAIVAVAYAGDDALLQCTGDSDVERHLLKAIAAT
jgi:2'-5' RNA ligase